MRVLCWFGWHRIAVRFLREGEYRGGHSHRGDRVVGVAVCRTCGRHLSEAADIPRRRR